jgi:hypothetical protein
MKKVIWQEPMVEVITKGLSKLARFMPCQANLPGQDFAQPPFVLPAKNRHSGGDDKPART